MREVFWDPKTFTRINLNLDYWTAVGFLKYSSFQFDIHYIKIGIFMAFAPYLYRYWWLLGIIQTRVSSETGPLNQAVNLNQTLNINILYNGIWYDLTAFDTIWRHSILFNGAQFDSTAFSIDTLLWKPLLQMFSLLYFYTTVVAAMIRKMEINHFLLPIFHLKSVKLYYYIYKINLCIPPLLYLSLALSASLSIFSIYPSYLSLHAFTTNSNAQQPQLGSDFP